MTSAQLRINNAILAHEQAGAEVDRLCDILERAADALAKARQTKRAAQKELDEAAKAISTSPRHLLTSQSSNNVATANGNDLRHEEEADPYTGDTRSEYCDEDSEEGHDYSSEESEEEEEREDGFDMGNEALEQIRYRLETAKIDPNSPEGAKILDELLVRLQSAKEEVIDADLVNRFIDELLFASEDMQTTNSASSEQNKQKPLPPQSIRNPKQQQQPRIRISRGGKVLGWYQGQLDERGYARQGSGSMYYDAGHECHGTWWKDEMVGRGIYQWSDGHVYDGEWLNGKRHGLGRFVRPDNVVLYGMYEKGHHKGEGVRWSTDRREAQVVVDGVPRKTVSLSKAKEIASSLGFGDVLPPPV